MTTALVETLTAEVRALMVGSRQVTLSVYRQLDEVSPTAVEPFGRVNDGKESSYYIWIVGRHRETGALVRAKQHPRPTPVQVDLTGLLCVSPSHHPAWRHSGFPLGEYGGAQFYGSAESNPEHHELLRPQQWTYKSPETQQVAQERLEAEVERHEEALGRAEEWQELPLIVLAGLR